MLARLCRGTQLPQPSRQLGASAHCPTLLPIEGSNINLKMHRLRQDIHDHLTSSYTGHNDDSTGQHGHPPAPELALSFDQFYQHMWSQFTVWDGHDGEWSQEREKEQALRKFVLLDTNADNKLTADVRGRGSAWQGRVAHWKEVQREPWTEWGKTQRAVPVDGHVASVLPCRSWAYGCWPLRSAPVWMASFLCSSSLCRNCFLPLLTSTLPRTATHAW